MHTDQRYLGNYDFIRILLFCLISFSGIGQTRLSGDVIDSESGLPLIGASVSINADQTGTVTDAEGKFELSTNALPPFIITFNYLGYREKVVSVDKEEVKTGLRIKMKPSTVALEEVTINGIAEGQIKAVIEMKKAENIKNVVSAAQIISFPDLNAAEVMQRIPGITLQRDQGEGRFVQLRGTPPELTNFNINGEQIPSPEGNFRYVGMDIIPSDQIEAVEVTKVMTPDMDADGIGGSVNIRTKSAVSGPPKIGLTMAGGYNQLRETPIYNLQASYGHRFNKLGFQINSSFFQNNQGSDNIEYKFTKGPFFNSDNQQQGVDNFNLHWREAQLRHYEITRTRVGISPTIDYNFSDRHRIYLQGMYNSFIDDEIRRRKIYDLEDPLNATYFLFGGIEHDVRSRKKNQQLSTIALGGEHKIENFELDYQFFYARASERIPDRIDALFDSPGQAITINFDDEDPEYPIATFPNPDNADNATNYENFELDELSFSDEFTKEDLFTPRINLKYNYAFAGGHKGYFKIGGKLRSRIKSRDVVAQTLGAYRQTSNLYPGEGAPFYLSSISDDFIEDNLLGKGYLLEQMPSPEMIRTFYEFYPQYFIYDRNESRKNSFNNDYSYAENIWAAYGMIRHEWGKMMIIAGLRYELTDILRNDGLGVVLNGSRFIGIDTIVSSRQQAFLLPQVQLRYRVNDKVNLRAAMTYSYSRPNYGDMIPSREEDRNEVSIGNPDLRFPFSRNFDLMIERYYNSSIISGGLFFKQIDDFVFSYKRFGREGAPGSGNFPVFEFTKPLNGKDAQVFGAELQAQFKFNGLPGFTKNFGLYSNYTYTYSQAFLPKRQPANYAEAIILDPLEDDLSSFFLEDETEIISLPGQAQHTANIGLFYDSKFFFARLTANYQDDFLVDIGPDPDFDEYYDSALRLDYTMNYQLNSKINFFSDWINLTNAPLRFYLGENEIVKQQEFYSWWTRVGLRIKL